MDIRRRALLSCLVAVQWAGIPIALTPLLYIHGPLAFFAFLALLTELGRSARAVPPWAAAFWRSLWVYSLPDGDVDPSKEVLLPKKSSERPRLVLVLPHGTFCEGAARSLPPEGTRSALFVDRTLERLSGTARLSMLSLGVADLLALDNDVVNRTMGLGRDVAVFPGGFLEASSGTAARERVNDETWLYWARKCVKYDYDVALRYVRGASGIFAQPEWGLALRLRLARLSIPCVFPSIPNVRQKLRLVSFVIRGPHRGAEELVAELRRRLDEEIASDDLLLSRDGAPAFPPVGYLRSRL